MFDLTASYLGLKLRTALVPSAPPLSQNIDRVRRLEDAGASAVVLYSLFEEQLREESREPRGSASGEGSQSVDAGR
jgi:dihydroorotate dehydrogenase (fumarate)